MNPNTLAVPGSRPRNDSIDSRSSQSTTGSYTVGASPSQASEYTQVADLPSEQDIWKPESDDEAKAFQVKDSPFGLTPGHLSKLIPRKNYAAFYTMHGLAGLERGLRTSVKGGLSADEESLTGSVTYDDVRSAEHDAEPKHDLRHNDTDATTETKVKETAFVDRRRIFGDNRIPERKSKGILQLAWIALKDKILVLLSIAAVISLALGLYQTFGNTGEKGARIEWVEGVAIIVAIFIVVFVGALNDWQKERQFVKLNKKKEDRLVKVIRSGKTVKVSVYDVFPGDVMILEQGDVLPVDGIFIQGHNVTCDESSATGESDLIKKVPAAAVFKALDDGRDVKKMDPFLISGAKVAEGFGSFIVTAVGEQSNYGKTIMSLREDNEVTPLQYKLNKLAGYIAKLGSSAGLILFTVLFIEFCARLPHSQQNAQQKAQDFLKILITSITIIVVAVPEGLPLAVTLALAFATKRMTKDHNLVRHLQSCETMGNATVVCSDKTGTLTQNVMTVVAGALGAGSLQFGDKEKLPVDNGESGSPTSDSGTETETQIAIHDLSAQLPPELQAMLKEMIAVNTTAFEGEENGKPAFIGSKTETALLDFAQKCLGLGILNIERANSPLAQLFPFDSGKKCMGAVVKHGENKYRMYIKGAPEILLGKCTRVVKNPTGSLAATAMNVEQRKKLQHVISSYAQMSLRTIALVYREFTEWPPAGVKMALDDAGEVEFGAVFQDLTWMGVVGIQDPVRAGVPAAVQDCKRAGVKVVMVTGDNVETARAIARECGILTEDGIVMEGVKFRSLNQFELLETVPNLCVLARSSPQDKKTLVKAFKATGHVVAVTGDGTNDAPALKAADVGFSMGITGTEVAKEASDIILMDDNFSSIVKALAWGRTINDAVKKFLQFQITVNITAVILTFVSAVSSTSEESVLNAVQLLWVNLIMDTFAALALATDPPADSLLLRRPEPRNSPLITLTMWKMIFGQTIFQLVVTFVLYFAGPSFLGYPDDQMRTLVFNVFVWMQIFNAINNRRIDNRFNILEGLLRNWFFSLILCIMIGGQVLIIFVGGAAFVVTPLNGVQWAISMIIGILSLPIGALIRCVPDRWVLAAYEKLAPEWYQRRRRRTPVAHIHPEEDFRLEWNRALMQIHSDLALYKRIRGGRLSMMKQGFRNPIAFFGRSRSGSRISTSPMHSALGMPGLIAGSIGGLSPIDRRSVAGSARSVTGSVEGGNSAETERRSGGKGMDMV
jgi:Ca2+-transporting ATPase